MPRKKPQAAWTADQVQALREGWGVRAHRWLRKHCGARSVGAYRTKANKLGLASRPQGLATLQALAPKMGCVRSTLARIVAPHLRGVTGSCRRSVKYYDPQDVEDVFREHLESWTIRDAARALRRDDKTIRRALRKAGIPLDKPEVGLLRYPPSIYRQMFPDTGEPPTYWAKQVDVSRQVIRSWLRIWSSRRGIPRPAYVRHAEALDFFTCIQEELRVRTRGRKENMATLTQKVQRWIDARSAANTADSTSCGTLAVQEDGAC